jgi:tetratricopeptide (TPR) repeat protein
MSPEDSQGNRRYASALIFVAFFCLLSALFFLQRRIDAQRGEFHEIEAFDFLPAGKYLRLAALEYKEVAADVLWLQAIQYVGGRDPSGQGYEWFYGVLDRVTDLDTRFAYAYYFGGIVLSVLSDHVDLSNAILEKGLKNTPDNWQIPFHLGFNYLFHLHDPLKAAQYMEKASKLEGHPAYLPLLTARLYKKGQDTETALAFLEEMYNHTDDEKIREKLIQRMKEIRLEATTEKR